MEKPSTLTHENNNTQMAEINKLLEDLDFESARVILEKKLKQEPNNVEYIDTLAEVLMNLDDAEATEKLIKKSISLEPNKNAEKYMTLGQLSDCRSALKLYEKGISIFQGDLNMEIDDNKRVQIKSSLASAYAAIAELFMNSDLCNDSNAEESCEKCLTEALKICPNSFDALIQMSNLRILRRRDEEALTHLDKIYTVVLHCINQNDDTNLPSQDLLLNLSKNYAELSQYIKAIKILDVLIRLDDEDLESWYLLAFNHYTIKNFKHAAKCLKNFKRVSQKVSHKTNQVLELEEAAAELDQTLETIRKNSHDGELKNNNLEETDDNDEERMSMNSSNADEMNLD